MKEVKDYQPNDLIFFLYSDEYGFFIANGLITEKVIETKTISNLKKTDSNSKILYQGFYYDRYKKVKHFSFYIDEIFFRINGSASIFSDRIETLLDNVPRSPMFPERQLNINDIKEVVGSGE